jgi:anti-sigma factor RsiW
MNWNCENIEERLSEYLDGGLPKADAETFSAHVAGCARCTALVASVRGLVGALHALEPVQPPPHLVSSILDQTIGPRTAPSTWRSWLGWTRALWQPRFAFGALTVVVTLVVVTQALGVPWRTPTLADLNPVNLYHSADRQAHLIYARGAKFFGDLRVVYEIQSRLQPSEPEAAPQKQPETQPKNPGKSEVPALKPLNQNRADSVGTQFTRFASALWMAPARSKP